MNSANGESLMPFKYLRDMKKYMKKYNKETQDDRVKRTAARRKALREGLVKKGDGKEIDHKVPLSKGGGNTEANTRVVSRKTNRKKYNK